MRLQTTIIAAALVLCSCGGSQQKANDPLADSGRTQRTENLLQNLKALGDSSVYLFGHHDDTVYGIGWEADYSDDASIHQRSDVMSVCNDYPALLSFDLGRLELGDARNPDGVPFERIRQEIIAHYDGGGLVTLSWQPEDEEPNRLADFLNGLETPYGVRVPIVLRLPNATKDEWRKTVEYLKDKGVVNALYAYSPGTEADGDETGYMERYPGDDIIDLLGLECYCLAPEADTTQIADYAARLDRNLGMVCAVAKKHQKAVALTETGYEGIKANDWWTHTLAPVLGRHPISYVLVGRNAHDKPGHFFAPYPGQLSASDFVRFYNDPQTLFLHDVNGLYLSK
jgi:mannan endo-1,4-beta-mannosidase